MPREAIADLNTALNREPDEEVREAVKTRLCDIHLRLSEDYRAKGLYDEALDELRAALKLTPEDKEAVAALCKIERLDSSLKTGVIVDPVPESQLESLMKKSAMDQEAPLSTFDKDDIMSVVKSLPLPGETSTRAASEDSEKGTTATTDPPAKRKSTELVSPSADVPEPKKSKGEPPCHTLDSWSK